MKNRLILSGLAATGAIETAVLTYSKFVSTGNSPPLCADLFCDLALTSKFASIPIVNIPLVSIGFVGYTTIALLTAFSLSSAKYDSLSKLNNGKPAAEGIDKFHDSLLLFLTTSMGTFSGYLLSVLLFVLHTPCAFCITSSVVSFAMAGIAWNSALVQNKTKAFVISSSSVLITLSASGFLYYATLFTNPSSSYAFVEPSFGVRNAAERVKETVSVNRPPPISTSSSSNSIQLAKKLNKLGAKLYGAYWCSHCNNQKQLFGKEAFGVVEYIECDDSGYNSQSALCKSKKVKMAQI